MFCIHPLIKYLSRSPYSNEKLEKTLSLLKNENIIFKKSGNMIIFKYNTEGKYGGILQRSCRGTIIDIDNLSLICSSIEGSYSYEEFKENVPINYCVIEENIEGTLINVYYYKNHWNVSTKFCINADESRFKNNQTYRQIFDKYIDINKVNLDKNYTYSFILTTDETKLVSNNDYNGIYHIETTNNITLEKIHINIGIKKPSILYYHNIKNDLNISSYDDINLKLNNLNWNHRGYMLYSIDRKFRCSLINPNYDKVKNLVSGQSDINYLCLNSYFYQNNKDEILEYFPEYIENFNVMLSRFNILVDKIYDLYKQLKCFKNDISIPYYLEKHIRKIHQHYLANVQLNKDFMITETYIKTYLNSLDCPYLYSLIMEEINY